ncbi:MAG: hypothetical protein WC023_09855 [Rhodocyclaceae bacterium]
MRIQRFQSSLLSACIALLVSACAGYAGHGLQPGVADLVDIKATMGEPAMQWQGADGSLQLSYPRGPEGPHSFMAYLGPDGRLTHIENVLNEQQFARIVPGETTQAEVLRLLGPPTPQWTSYFKARDELVWEWLYCDYGNQNARLDVLFDGREGVVRTTFSRPDYRGPDGAVPPCGRLP